MKVLIKETLSKHKFKDLNGYLICTDCILARTGKQSYRRNEVFATDDISEIEIDRPYEEVFNAKTLASFENVPLCKDHPDEDVTPENHNSYSVGFVRNIRQGKDNNTDVIIGDLVITDSDVIELVENGEYCELSCGYNTDIIGDDKEGYKQTNIRGNHVALCQQGRAGNARIVDSKLKLNYSRLDSFQEDNLKSKFNNYHVKFSYDRNGDNYILDGKKEDIVRAIKNIFGSDTSNLNFYDSVKDEDIFKVDVSLAEDRDVSRFITEAQNVGFTTEDKGYTIYLKNGNRDMLNNLKARTYTTAIKFVDSDNVKDAGENRIFELGNKRQVVFSTGNFVAMENGVVYDKGFLGGSKYNNGKGWNVDDYIKHLKFLGYKEVNDSAIKDANKNITDIINYFKAWGYPSRSELQEVVDFYKLTKSDMNTINIAFNNHYSNNDLNKLTYHDSIKDAQNYVINFRNDYEGFREKIFIKANSAIEALKEFSKNVILNGWGTRNVTIISVSPNDGNMRLYGNLYDLIKSTNDSVKDSILGKHVIIRPRDVRMNKYVDERGIVHSYEGTNADDMVEVKLNNGQYVEVRYDEIRFLDASCKDELYSLRELKEMRIGSYKESDIYKVNGKYSTNPNTSRERFDSLEEVKKYIDNKYSRDSLSSTNEEVTRSLENNLKNYEAEIKDIDVNRVKEILSNYDNYVSKLKMLKSKLERNELRLNELKYQLNSYYKYNASYGSAKSSDRTIDRLKKEIENLNFEIEENENDIASLETMLKEAKNAEKSIKDKVSDETIKLYQAEVDYQLKHFGRIGGGLYGELDDNGLYVDNNNIVKRKVNDSIKDSKPDLIKLFDISKKIVLNKKEVK